MYGEGGNGNIMSHLRELYQELIIDHGRHPRHFGQLDGANHIKEGYNPLCGDKLTCYVIEKNGVIEAASFEGVGCAISMASASLMLDALIGKNIQEADVLFQTFHELLTLGHTSELTHQLGKLIALSGVAEFPARVKCATLAWHTMQGALHNNDLPVSTEND